MKKDDQVYLTEMMAQVIRTFGTEDSEWYCATQTVLNSLFNLKSNFTHEQAKTFINSIMKNFGQQSNEEQVELIDEEVKPLELR